MTVKELIAALQEMPEDMTVALYDYSEDGYNEDVNGPEVTTCKKCIGYDRKEKKLQYTEKEMVVIY